MTDASGFDNPTTSSFADAEPLAFAGGTCLAFRVRRYGKWHFLKRLKPEYSSDPRYVMAMEKEFETAYQLEHPALPRYIERGNDYILMEFIDGWTLTDFLNTHPTFFEDKTRLQTFCQQLLQALQYLHAHQILHLDLKPDNILLTRIGQEVRLVDFGCCYTDCNPFTTGHTDLFAAPEQLSAAVDSRALTPSTDLYAFGRILDYLSVSASLPPLYRKVMNKCLAERPEDRLQSAQEVQQALAPKKSVSIAIVALFLLFSLAILGWWLKSSSSFSSPPSTISDSLPSSPVSVSQDTSSLSVPIEAQEPQPSRNSEDVNVRDVKGPEKQKKKTNSPFQGQNAQLDDAVITACRSVLQSTVETFRDSIHPSLSPSVNEHWLSAVKQCHEELSRIEHGLQQRFKDQIPPEKIHDSIRDYVDGEIDDILQQMAVNSRKQGKVPN